MRQRHSISLFLVLAFSCTSPLLAEAQITVDRSIFYWSHLNPPVQNVSVRNSAEQPMFVEVKAEEVINPGTAGEHRDIAQDIIVAPKRFSVPAKGERVVRLLRKGSHGDSERVFRVSFIPQARESTDEEKTETARTHGAVQTTLKVLSGVGILIFTEPKEITPLLETERDGDTVRLKNTGNVNVLISKIRKCLKENEACEEVTPKRLYPGNSLEVAGTSGKVVTFTKRIGNEFSEATVE